MKITDKNIAQHLQKYMDGRTSIEEEQMLAQYFRKHGKKPAPDGLDNEDWQVYREIFSMFAPKPQLSTRRVQHIVAASAAILLAFGTWMWTEDSQPALQAPTTYPLASTTAAIDSTTIEAVTDTSKIEIPIPQPAAKPATRKGINRNRFRDAPPLPRHYMAQTSTTDSSTINLNEAIHQADLLMQAVYVQQQSDINNIMNQYAATMASIDDYCEDEEITYY
ncbi:MAG: hypothetical protein NC344_08945 [Bacteroidales bacterium]|nr:hypothetical protein [Bacteroidales bacterium]MCM1147935.1 hypothetical protein [Bacteroidales bacterium]MCM1205484.1 hypothetical protein [Bacillota bacterium]MCM1509254.1 hypothetical protein [Clostridium sp.]